MDEVEFDARLEDPESDEARASEMQNAIEHEINVRFDEDPVQYGSLRERLEELIEEYREGRHSERETIEELRTLMDEIRSRDKAARSKGLRDETDLSFYHAVEEVLDEHDAGEQDLVELTADLVGTVEEFVTKVEWKERTHLQNRMRKEVTGELYRSGIGLSGRNAASSPTALLSCARPLPMSGRLQRQHHIGQTVVPYSIDWSENRETMSLSIDESLELTVTAPMDATVADVESVLDSRQEWLLEKLYGLKDQEGRSTRRST